MKLVPWAMLAAAGVLSAADQFHLFPKTIVLNGPEARQQILAESTSGSFDEDWTAKAQWTSADPKIAAVDASGVIRPISDGETTITGTANGQQASVKVKIVGAKAAFTWNFKNHVIPVMTKAGCNQGACHGALAGKNGFKLTLRGYDPEADYDTLTRVSVGRRISLAEPDASLILMKPAFVIPHGGGKRFDQNSLEYRVIGEWIAAGAPGPSAKDPDVIGLEVFPAVASLKVGSEQQLVVRARFTDGHVDDVTRWVKFSSNNEGVASVDDLGRVKINGPGEAAVTLWYSSRVLYARMTSPYPNQVASEAYTQFPRHNYIDDLVLDKLKKLNIAPSKIADDSTFVRRAYLDAAGILPSAEEVETFLADKSAEKRAALIDRLLAKDEFTDYWAYKWSDLLLVSSRKLRPNAMWAFYDWIRDGVKANKPWDQFTREIFTGTGSSRQNGALNYFVLHKDPIDLAENVTEAFLGQRITCARCHNHPLEKWTQKQYYQFANLLSRVGTKNGSEAGDVVVYAKTSGNIDHPRLLKPLAPAPLDGTALSLDSTEDRRVALADWLTSPKNPYFARSFVNRVFANFMGRGLVNPVDDVRATNPASNEELLAALTKDFVAHKFDVQYLIRTIMNSAVYQLSAEANATNQNDNVFYSKYLIKRLPAEVVLDTYAQVTGVATPFPGYPAGTRAMQLPDTQVKSEFLTIFGRPARILCDSGERSVDPTIAQALHVINGDTLNKKLAAPDSYISLFLKVGLSDSRMIDQIYLSAFSRFPNEAEKASLIKDLDSSRLKSATPEAMRDARRQGLEDLFWALLTSKEFLFNH